MNYNAEKDLGLYQSSEKELCFVGGVVGLLQWSHCWIVLCSGESTLLDFIYEMLFVLW